MSQHQLYLSQDVFFCMAEDYCVFLNLQKDKYLSTSRADMLALGPWLGGWTHPGSEVMGGSSMPSPINAFAIKLVNMGILTSNKDASRPAVPTAVYPSAIELEEIEGITSATPSAVDWTRFALAAASAHICLTRRHLKDTVRIVLQKKDQMAGLEPKVDLQKVGRLVSTFTSLRHMFPRSYLCLYDSLALLLFLARFNVFPVWVFGVRSNPFMAHCWLQYGSTVLNDTIDEVRGYTPIMKV